MTTYSIAVSGMLSKLVESLPLIFYMRLVLIIIFCCLSFYQSAAYADKCPDREQIIARDLSQQYEWSVAEGVSLQELLAVEQLSRVSIINHGEFVRCEYRGDKPALYLDAMPQLIYCDLAPAESIWVSKSDSEQVCLESNPNDCRFKKVCHYDLVPDEDTPAAIEDEEYP